METPQQTSESFALPITNHSANEVVFFLEPWGEYYPMPPHATFTVRAPASIGNALSLEFASGSITVWSSVSVQLFAGDSELGAGFGPRLTPPAEGMDFIKYLFSQRDE